MLSTPSADALLSTSGWPRAGASGLSRDMHVARQRIPQHPGMLGGQVDLIVWLLAVADVGHSEGLDMAVFLELGREVEGVASDVLEYVEAAAE